MLPVRLLESGLDRLNLARLEGRTEHWVAATATLPVTLRMLLLTLAAVAFTLATTTPLNGGQQLSFFVLLWLTAMITRRVPGDLPTLILIGLSLVASGRYIWWRLTHTLIFDSAIEAFFGFGLVLAEAYTWLIMVLGYVQNALPLRRQPVPLPSDPALWPTVDVFIPSYNEPLHVVKPTLYAALGLDWPQDKLRVYLLDDGRRPEFRAFCEQIGARYLVRGNNAHAKAGNLNAALKLTDGEFVAIFDCDHVPVRSFLKTTLGWFQRDPRCAMVQTPHHFFSPDPFERNLGTFRRVPNEGSLFYGLVQDGNDLWNSTFFCGSCAVIRRKPLEEVGGIAVETVTEDAHTALKMHRRGYTTAYLNVVQAAGLATESLAGHVGQRIRWARGMAQIFRIDNPLLGRGLRWFQRLCYSNAMLHFFNGIPRLVFLTAPLSYLYFEMHVIYAMATHIALYAIPHLVMAELANSRMQGRYRHSFWAEVYEAVLAWYTMLPTTVAFINPRLGKFNVTAKGGLVESAYFDTRIARPYLVLMLLNLGGLLIGLGRLFVWNTEETGTVVMNLIWAFYNLLMLGAALGVAAEARQVRAAHRVPVRIAAQVRSSEGQWIPCETADFSTTGLGMTLPASSSFQRGDLVEVRLGESRCDLPARVSQWRSPHLGLQFEALTPDQESALVLGTFGKPDLWQDWAREQTRDQPLSSLGEIFAYGLNGYRHFLRYLADSLLTPAPARARHQPERS